MVYLISSRFSEGRCGGRRCAHGNSTFELYYCYVCIFYNHNQHQQKLTGFLFLSVDLVETYVRFNKHPTPGPSKREIQAQIETSIFQYSQGSPAQSYIRHLDFPRICYQLLCYPIDNAPNTKAKCFYLSQISHARSIVNLHFTLTGYIVLHLLITKPSSAAAAVQVT